MRQSFNRMLLIIPLLILFTFSSLAAAKTTVSVWSWRSQDAPIWEAVEAKLQELGGDIEIDFRAITATQYDAVLSTAMQGGEGPDVITSRAGNTVASYANAGQYLALEGEIDLSLFDEGALASFSYKGIPYAIPFAVQTLHIYYNKDIYNRLGLEVPETWDELIHNLEAVKSSGLIPMFVAGREAWTLPLIFQAIGATWLGDEWSQRAVNREVDFSDPALVEVLEKIMELEPYYQDHYTASNYTDMNMAFTTGMAAHMIDGIWTHSGIEADNPNLDFGLFLVPGPTADTPKRVYAYPDGGYAVNADSPVKEAALKVVGFMAQVEGGQIFTDSTLEPSGVPGVQAPADAALLQQALEEYATQVVSPIFGIRSVFNATPIAADQEKVESYQGVNSLVQEAIQGMFVGELTPQQAAELINDGLKWYFEE